MHWSIVMLILLQCSYNSKLCQSSDLPPTDFHPKLLWVVWRVTAGASIPFVSSSDLTMIVSFFWYWVKEGMPKKVRNRKKRTIWRIVFETRARSSFISPTTPEYAWGRKSLGPYQFSRGYLWPKFLDPKLSRGLLHLFKLCECTTNQGKGAEKNPYFLWSFAKPPPQTPPLVWSFYG